MVPDFLILSSVPEVLASPAGFSLYAGALLSLQALSPSMSALAQSREVMVRFCVMYKTPFCVFHYHLLSLLLMNRQSAPESLRLFCLCQKTHRISS